MRKYPAVAVLNRIAKEDFTIPNSNYTIPKGMRVVISTPGISQDPKHFPDPEKFDPSRFTKENLATRSNYVHLGFGKGPRICIGKKNQYFFSFFFFINYNFKAFYKFFIAYLLNVNIINWVNFSIFFLQLRGWL